MNILFLSRWYPYPADNGSKLRIFNLLRQLSSQHTVDLISFTSGLIQQEGLEPLKSICRSIITVPYQPFKPYRTKAILGLFSPLPRSILDTDNVEMHTAIQKKVRETRYNLVIASEVDMAQYARNLPIKKILEDIELAPLHERAEVHQNPFRKLRNRLMWQKWMHYITNMMHYFNGGTVVSEPERKLVSGLLHKMGCDTPVQIIPNGVDISYYQKDFSNPTPDTIIFTGALTYSANYNAMEFFLRDIFPLIQAKIPAATLTITGQHDGVPIDRLPVRSGVVFSGYVADIRPAIGRSWVSIVPLRIGGGTRLKILESLALGTPVVATSKGAEGLELTPGHDILIADSPAEFASAVLSLLEDSNLRTSLSKNGKDTVFHRYDWQTIGRSFEQFISQIGQ